MGFIYTILNKNNGKIYVGQTSQGRYRFSQHKSNLRANTHPNPHLQASWNKYGEDSFEFNVLEHCNDDKLGDNERWWINYFNSDNREKGYNLKEGGDRGFKFSEESLKRMSESHKGKIHSEKTKQKMSESHKGRKLSKSHRENISKAKMGSNNPMYGLKGELSPSYGRCKELSAVYKPYPRIVKNGYRNGLQRYSIKYDGEVIKTSTDLDKLEKYLEDLEY